MAETREPAPGWAWCRDEACIEATFQKLSEHHQRFYGRGHQHVASDPRTRTTTALRAALAALAPRPTPSDRETR